MHSRLLAITAATLGTACITINGLTYQTAEWNDYRNDELGVTLRYAGSIRPILKKDKDGTVLLVPFGEHDGLMIVQTDDSADGFSDTAIADIKKEVHAYKWILMEKGAFVGYPAWHLRFIRRRHLNDFWLIARNSLLFEVGCLYGSVTPTRQSKDLCQTMLSNVSFLGGQNDNADPELGRGVTWHVAPMTTTSSRPAVALRWENLPLLPSRGSTESVWTEEFKHTIKGLLEQAGADVADLQVVIQDAGCGPHGIACVEGSMDGRKLQLIYSRAEATESLNSPEGRRFVWYVLLHETHHVLTWKTQTDRLEHVFQKALQAQAREFGIITDFSVQCLDAGHVVAIPTADLSTKDRKRVASLVTHLYPPIAEADEAAEEVFADAYAVKQWSQLFDGPAPEQLVQQVFGYLYNNLSRIKKADEELQHIAPAASRIVETDLAAQAQENVDELKRGSEDSPGVDPNPAERTKI